MAFKKFADNEVLTNTMKTYPRVDFIIADGNVYYNSTPHQSGTRNSTVRNVPFGYTSLYEYNIDRPEIVTGRTVGSSSIPDTGRIYPWVSKDSAGAAFKTVGATGYANEFQYGDIIRNTYPLSASITREHTASAYTNTSSYNPHYVGLRNKLEFYAGRSSYYAVSGASIGTKDSVPLSLISVPSIFYGTKIKPGSVSLKWYFTGSICAELQDKNKNGELIQVKGPDSTAYKDAVAGVVLYEQGIILLTGSWELNHQTLYLRKPEAGMPSPTQDNPKWVYFGAGANDGVNQSTAGSNFQSASFDMSFEGVTETQVLTMFARAKKGEVNYSNNPTYLEYGQEKLFMTSSTIYEENSSVKLKNFVSSSYTGYNAPFKRQVFISRIAIYDRNKNLIGVATMNSPVLKEESEDYMFKLKLDL